MVEIYHAEGAYFGSMKVNVRFLLIVLLTFWGAFSLGQASVEPYQVVINGKPSKLKVLHDKDSLLVPLTLPASEDPQEWTVSLLQDRKSHRIDVKMNVIKKKLRGDVQCYWCNGSGQCAQDYPAGSGLDYSGGCESNCNGTGDCYHCAGTGKL